MRRLLAIALLAAGAAWAQPVGTPTTGFAKVVPGVALGFPRDHGSHPSFRYEWWYFTGWLESGGGKPLGFQITFFRSRPATDAANPSAFAPKQILFAHAAISDPVIGKLIHDQRAARSGFGLAQVAETDTQITLLDWNLVRERNGRFRARTPAKGFALDLAFMPSQPAMANGERGYSRKGPGPDQASYYYSMPHMKVRGTATIKGKRVAVAGQGWLDREWSSQFLDKRAVGWDWAGINLDDGSALMAFRMRGPKGEALYAGGTLRRADGTQVVFAPGDVRFVARRRWRSPRTGGNYPVEAEFVVRLPEGVRRFPLKPLFDAQELDGRATGMPTYWEGAVSTPGGRGYLELTGYADALTL